MIRCLMFNQFRAHQMIITIRKLMIYLIPVVLCCQFICRLINYFEGRVLRITGDIFHSPFSNLMTVSISPAPSFIERSSGSSADLTDWTPVLPARSTLHRSKLKRNRPISNNLPVAIEIVAGLTPASRNWNVCHYNSSETQKLDSWALPKQKKKQPSAVNQLVLRKVIRFIETGQKEGKVKRIQNKIDEKK